MGVSGAPPGRTGGRGRAFLIAYVMTDNAAFSWALALNRVPEASTSNRMDVQHTRDDVIVQGLRDLAEMKAQRG